MTDNLNIVKGMRSYSIEVHFNARACGKNLHFESGNFWHCSKGMFHWVERKKKITFIWIEVKDMWLYYLWFKLDMKGSYTHSDTQTEYEEKQVWTYIWPSIWITSHTHKKKTC